MSTKIYTLPIEQTRWHTPVDGEVVFNWEYDEGRDKLLNLYDKGKRLQWNAADRIDWTLEVDPGNPLGIPEEYNLLYDSPVWDKMSGERRAEVRRHMVAWQFSQFLHGEQGALICASKIVQTVPDLDSKYYAATQVIDEARHVEIYSRFLREKVDLAYPINPHLRELLDQTIRDKRWDFTYLGMQILIEGLALAAFGTLRDFATNPLVVALNAYVMQDEARHVAFGRLALRDLYPELTDHERDQREEFCVEACYLMRDRFVADEVWANLGFGSEVIGYVRESLALQEFRKLLFSRIVPALKEIGLWGPKIRAAFEDMGVIGFAELDSGSLGEQDERIARELDAQRAAADAAVAAAVRVAEDADD